MIAIGTNEYEHIAKQIINTTTRIKKILLEMGSFDILTDVCINVIAFKIKDNLDLGDGATYALAYELSKENIILNTLLGDTVHICITPATASNKYFINDFKIGIEKSLHRVKTVSNGLKKTGGEFSGDAGMYCDLDSAINPDSTKLSTSKWLESYILGELMAEDALRVHFIALIDPYKYSFTN